ncbi:MAG: class I SAM-dependent methyltransferase [Promethearchaeota archaeon]
MESWETKDGVEFLARAGVREGMVVLDFGARVGHYSIPAALVVGPTGRVLSLDKDDDELEVLGAKAQRLGLENVELVRTGGELSLPFHDGKFDFAMVYDVLHYMVASDRATLYAELHRVLGDRGTLSVYPKHVKDDWALMEFRNVTVADVTREVEAAGFTYAERHCGEISHDDWINEGCVYNFRKKSAGSLG